MKAIAEMSRDEKLRTMEDLWDSLWPEQNLIDSPAWHGDELAERERRIASGEARFTDWETVRKRLADLP